MVLSFFYYNECNDRRNGFFFCLLVTAVLEITCLSYLCLVSLCQAEKNFQVRNRRLWMEIQQDGVLESQLGRIINLLFNRYMGHGIGCTTALSRMHRYLYGVCCPTPPNSLCSDNTRKLDGSMVERIPTQCQNPRCWQHTKHLDLSQWPRIRNLMVTEQPRFVLGACFQY